MNFKAISCMVFTGQPQENNNLNKKKAFHIVKLLLAWGPGLKIVTLSYYMCTF